MSCPANTGKIIAYVKTHQTTINNEIIYKLAGGSHTQWEESLKGYKVRCSVEACNAILANEGIALVSEGVGSQKWQLVSAHEAHRRKAYWNFDRIDGAYKRAHDSVEAIVKDTRAPKKIRKEAKAWLQLFEEPRSKKGLAIMREFANELLVETAKYETQLRLVAVKKTG